MSLFDVKFKGEDKWATHPTNATVNSLRANHQVTGLPDKVTLAAGQFAGVIPGLQVHEPADFAIEFLDDTGSVVFTTNPIRIEDAPTSRHFWGICTASQKKPSAPAQPRHISNLPAITHLSISSGIR